MSARILAPRGKDTFVIPLGGNVTVTSTYNYGATSTLRSFVDADADGGTPLILTGVNQGIVHCTKAAGDYVVPVRIETDGVQDDIQPNVKLSVAAMGYVVQSQRTNPPETFPLPPKGIPVEFLIFGTAQPNAT